MKKPTFCNKDGINVYVLFKDLFQHLHNVELARDMQDMRIRKKKRQTILPLSGSLFLNKTSGVTRITLKAAVNEKLPGRYTPKQASLGCFIIEFVKKERVLTCSYCFVVFSCMASGFL